MPSVPTHLQSVVGPGLHAHWVVGPSSFGRVLGPAVGVLYKVHAFAEPHQVSQVPETSTV